MLHSPKTVTSSASPDLQEYFYQQPGCVSLIFLWLSGVARRIAGRIPPLQPRFFAPIARWTDLG